MRFDALTALERRSLPLHATALMAGAHFLLGAAGEQKENGLGASGGIAQWHTGRQLGAACTGNCRSPLRARPEWMRRGLQIAGCIPSAHFGSVPSSVDERTLKGILLLLACCTQEESV
jgi:hypothetical protein